jgi:hypothetical protein
VLDVAYVGSSSKSQLGYEYINAVPNGAKFLPENQDPTRPPSTTPGATALPDDFLRPYPGYGDIGLEGYRTFSNYHSLQTSIQRRFDNGFMFSAFYVWSMALGIMPEESGGFRPNATDEEIRRADYTYMGFDRARARAATATARSTPRASHPPGRQRRHLVGPLVPARPRVQQPRSLDLEDIHVRNRVRFEVRLDAFNALNHTQFSGINSMAVFASLSTPTILNPPYDDSGNLVRYNGFGTINGVRPPRTIQLVARLAF